MNGLTPNNLLTNWYADPVDEKQAQAWADTAIKRTDKLSLIGRISFSGILLQVMSDWWLNENRTHFPQRGMFYANTRRKLALYHLLAGQLMMSCKLESAMDYLDMGLRHADGLISPENYFQLYNRHEELRFLKLSPTRTGPYTLQQLLNESRVMRKLVPNSRYSIPKS